MSDTIEIFLTELHKQIRQKSRIVLAVDGECGSLKTTLAQALQIKYGAGVIHCDDFFLTPELRTDERLTEPGGNIDYLRMKKEVIDKLPYSQTITYHPFDCHSMAYAKKVSVADAKLMIVEGVYAMHPYFGKYYDMSLFLCVKEEEKYRRIAGRGQDVERFRERWIPLENRYFDEYKVREQADFIIETTDVWKPTIDYVKDKVVECNTAYEGKQRITEKH